MNIYMLTKAMDNNEKIQLLREADRIRLELQVQLSAELYRVGPRINKNMFIDMCEIGWTEMLQGPTSPLSVSKAATLLEDAEQEKTVFAVERLRRLAVKYYDLIVYLQTK